MTESSITCCDCFIGIVFPKQSELLTFETEKVKKLYNIFTDNVIPVILQHTGIIRRKLGEGLEFYFPKTSELGNLTAFNDALECCIRLVEIQKSVSDEVEKRSLPAISYKVTGDYETLNIAGDLIWDKPPSTAYKIFTLTQPNTNVAIIAEDLRTILTKFPEFNRYRFNNLGKISLVGKEPNYDVYSVSRV